MSIKARKLIAAMLVIALAAPSAHAEMIGSESAVTARERIAALLERPELRSALEARGVDPEAAKTRVAALSDAEAKELARRIGTAPAGGRNPLVIIAAPVILAALAVALVVAVIGGLLKLARGS
jgi:hypothetical protein